MSATVRLFVVALAEAFLRGPWEADQLAARVKSVLNTSRRRTWIIWLARRVVSAFPGPMPPRSASLMEFLERDELLRHLLERCRDESSPIPEFDLTRLPRPIMQPARGAAATWDVRSLVTTGEVADWLGLTIGELDWFANRQRRKPQPADDPLNHYRYRWIPKRSGGCRLLEVPKPRLKQIQRTILHEILAKIPPHPAAMAFRRGKSITSFVAPHVDKRMVLHIDLCEFFPSVRAAQVHAIFRTAGYPEEVASILTGLCTNVTPANAFDPLEDGVSRNERFRRYASAHLAQGAPTSPALANLAAFWLDCRLSGLAKKVEADYTRYADDLVFSGREKLARCSPRFRVLVTAITHHEGFEIRRRKTREMLSGSRQQVAGIVLNRHLNMPRHEYDALRALLYNCCVRGPESQNLENHPKFREHLLGRIGYWSKICPTRAAKLKVLFDEIVWD